MARRSRGDRRSPRHIVESPRRRHRDDRRGTHRGRLRGDAAVDPAVVELERETQEVRALAAGVLDPTIEPGSLFEVSIEDEAAVRVDAARLRALLLEVEAASQRAERLQPDHAPARATPGSPTRV